MDRPTSLSGAAPVSGNLAADAAHRPGSVAAPPHEVVQDPLAPDLLAVEQQLHLVLALLLPQASGSSIEVFIRYIPGLYQVYPILRYIPGIYQVYPGIYLEYQIGS